MAVFLQDGDPRLERYRPCVGVMLINQSGLIFTGERIDAPGAWQMPQGGMEKGEDVMAAGLRELTEETGVMAGQVTVLDRTNGWLIYDLPPALQKKSWKGKYLGQSQQWLLARLEADDSVIDLEADDHVEFARWRWSPPDQVIDDIIDFKRETYRAVIDAFAGYLASQAR